jgi:cobalt-zinc-cadmium efflux system membrane fusion protein
MGGFLLSTKLLPGMHVKKGEEIAALEDAEYIGLQEDYLIARSQLQVTEAEYIRQKTLNESKAGSDKSLQMAKSEYEKLNITFHALREKLRMLNINADKISPENISKTIRLHAPFDGFVSKINVNVGKYVTPSEPLFELVNPDDIHLNITVFEKDLASLQIGQKLQAFTLHDPEKKYPCEIILISRDVSEERTGEVHCHFEKYDRNLIPGMYMNALIETSGHVGLAISSNAIVSYSGKDYVFVEMAKGLFEMKEVKTGWHGDGMTEILDAEKMKSAKIVTSNAYTLLMALKNKAD